MEKDEVIRISGNYEIRGLLFKGDVRTILSEYCIEHDKPYYETTMFVETLLNEQIAWDFFIEALEYYQKKFHVEKLYNKPDESGKRILISIN